jgi:hypothetical protein
MRSVIPGHEDRAKEIELELIAKREAERAEQAEQERIEKEFIKEYRIAKRMHIDACKRYYDLIASSEFATDRQKAEAWVEYEMAMED